MTNFVTDLTSLAATKSDWETHSEIPLSQKLIATEVNDIVQACYDLRSAVLNIPAVTSIAAGLAPASGGGTTNFLRADGSWAAPAGGGGGGGVSGSGTAGTFAKWSASGTLADSAFSITEASATSLTIGGATGTDQLTINATTNLAATDSTQSGLTISHSISGGTTNFLGALYAAHSGTVDATTTKYMFGAYASCTTTRSAGAGLLINYGLYAEASGSVGQNIGIYGNVSGANGTHSYSMQLDNTATASTGNYGLHINASGVGGSNFGIVVGASGASVSNVAIQTERGDVVFNNVSGKTSCLGDFYIKGSVKFAGGTGTPEGAVTGNVGDIFIRTDVAGIYQKTSGAGNTGWTLK